jgi:hypothetical protein
MINVIKELIESCQGAVLIGSSKIKDKSFSIIESKVFHCWMTVPNVCKASFNLCCSDLMSTLKSC